MRYPKKMRVRVWRWTPFVELWRCMMQHRSFVPVELLSYEVNETGSSMPCRHRFGTLELGIFLVIEISPCDSNLLWHLWHLKNQVRNLIDVPNPTLGVIFFAVHLSGPWRVSVHFPALDIAQNPMAIMIWDGNVSDQSGTDGWPTFWGFTLFCQPLSERHFLGAICFMTFKKPEQMNLTDSPDQEAWCFGGFWGGSVWRMDRRAKFSYLWNEGSHDGPRRHFHHDKLWKAKAFAVTHPCVGSLAARAVLLGMLWRQKLTAEGRTCWQFLWCLLSNSEFLTPRWD